MIGRPSPYYRRNSQKIKKWRNILIISLVLIIVAIMVFLIVGNILKAKVDGPSDDTSNETSSSSTTSATPQPIYGTKINGYALNIFEKTSVQLQDEISVISEQGATSVSLNLTDAEGKLLYSSKVAQKFGYQSSPSGLIDLASLNAKIASSGMSSNAIITLNSFTEEDMAIRSVIQAYESALVCEISDLGTDDIIIRCPDIQSNHIKELRRIAESVKNINENVKVGLALDNTLLASSDASVLVDDIMGEFDFIALDLSTIGDEDLIEHIENSLSSEKYYYILRYNMRVLLPDPTSEESKEKILEIMESNSITNWQTVANS